MRFDAIVIGGGHTGMAKATELLKLGKKVCVISKGRSVYGFDAKEFESLEGTLLMGDEICNVNWENGKPVSVNTVNLEEVAVEADEFYLATGKFFAGGLVADMNSIYEPIFSLDVDFDEDREKWFGEKFSDPQPFLSFGVRTSSEGHALKNGAEISNITPLGEIISNR